MSFSHFLPESRPECFLLLQVELVPRLSSYIPIESLDTNRWQEDSFSQLFYEGPWTEQEQHQALVLSVNIGAAGLKGPPPSQGVKNVRCSYCSYPRLVGLPYDSAGKESTWNVGDMGSIPGFGRSPGEGKGYPLPYSCLEKSMDCIVHGVTKNPHYWAIFTSLE